MAKQRFSESSLQNKAGAFIVLMGFPLMFCWIGYDNVFFLFSSLAAVSIGGFLVQFAKSRDEKD